MLYVHTLTVIAHNYRIPVSAKTCLCHDTSLVEYGRGLWDLCSYIEFLFTFHTGMI